METKTLQDAIALIDAQPHGDGYAYHASETKEWVAVSKTEMDNLVRYMNGENGEEPKDAYSLWACGVGYVIEDPNKKQPL